MKTIRPFLILILILLLGSCKESASISPEWKCNDYGIISTLDNHEVFSVESYSINCSSLIYFISINDSLYTYIEDFYWNKTLKYRTPLLNISDNTEILNKYLSFEKSFSAWNNNEYICTERHIFRIHSEQGTESIEDNTCRYMGYAELRTVIEDALNFDFFENRIGYDRMTP